MKINNESRSLICEFMKLLGYCIAVFFCKYEFIYPSCLNDEYMRIYYCTIGIPALIVFQRSRLKKYLLLKLKLIIMHA